MSCFFFFGLLFNSLVWNATSAKMGKPAFVLLELNFGSIIIAERCELDDVVLLTKSLYQISIKARMLLLYFVVIFFNLFVIVICSLRMDQNTSYKALSLDKYNII